MTSCEASYRDDQVTVHLWHVESGESGVYHLEWTDGINEWSETYVRSHVAFARFAVLLAASAQDRGFLEQNTRDFIARVDEFVEERLQRELPRSRFRIGEHVVVTLALPRPTRYTARFLREERNDGGSLTGVALVRVVDPGDSSHQVGDDVHVGVAALESA